jgi:hypothetical protein
MSFKNSVVVKCHSEIAGLPRATENASFRPFLKGKMTRYNAQKQTKDHDTIKTFGVVCSSKLPIGTHHIVFEGYRYPRDEVSDILKTFGEARISFSNRGVLLVEYSTKTFYVMAAM